MCLAKCVFGEGLKYVKHLLLKPSFESEVMSSVALNGVGVSVGSHQANKWL